MTSNKEGINMGKKKKGYGKIAVLMLVLTLILAFTGFASAEQEWLPGYGDKNGTLGKDGQSWRIGYINTNVYEGPTSNGFETFVSATDPTAINRLLYPDESGVLLSTGGLTGVIPLSDATVLIGNSGGLGEEQSVTLTGPITGTLTNAGGIATTAALADTKVFIGNSAGEGVAQSISLTGDITGTLTNSGGIAATLAANAVGASELNRIVNTLVIAGGSASNAIGDNALYNASGYTLTPRNNNATGAWIANSTFDVNGNVTVFVNDTLAAGDDFTLEIMRWAP